MAMTFRISDYHLRQQFADTAKIADRREELLNKEQLANKIKSTGETDKASSHGKIKNSDVKKCYFCHEHTSFPKTVPILKRLEDKSV